MRARLTAHIQQIADAWPSVAGQFSPTERAMLRAHWLRTPLLSEAAAPPMR